MLPYNLSIYAGESCRIQVTVLDSAGAVVDLTGMTKLEYSVSTMFPAAGSLPAMLIHLTLGAGITLTTPLSGIFDIQMTQVHTLVLQTAESSTKYYHQCKVLFLDGRAEVVLAGYLVASSALLGVLV